MKANRALLRAAFAALCILLLGEGCAKKRAAAPPPPPPPPPQQPAAVQNVFALLPEPGGTTTGIVVRNQAGTQELTVPNQAVNVDGNNVAPGAPYNLSDADVRRLFGSAIDVLPEPEELFVLHFDEGRDTLNAESAAMIPSIMASITRRHSTMITITGHTDTTSTPQFNYRLGLRRATTVETILRRQGVRSSDLFVSSHGDADLLIQTPRNRPEARNRRVEVTVR